MEKNILNDIKIQLSNNIAIKGEKMTANSHIMQCFVPPYSATVVELLDSNNLKYEYSSKNDEFGIKAIIDKKDNKNAFTNYPLISLDFSGIPRIYAQEDNKYAFKPSYGTFSRYGVSAVANSFEQLAITDINAERILNLAKILAKYDGKDQNSKENENFDVDYESLEKNGIKIGVPIEVKNIIKNEKVAQGFFELVEKLKDSKVSIEEVNKDFLDKSMKTYAILSNVEISSNMSRYDSLVYGFRTEEYETIEEMYEKSRQEGLGLDIKCRVLLGNYLIGIGQREKYYDVAMDERRSIKSLLEKIFEEFDLILLPTAPMTSDELSKKENLTDLFYNEIFTSLANLGGNPVMQVPISENYGIQLIGRNFKDIDVFRGCKLIEEIIHEL